MATEPLIARWNGTSWASVASPLPAGAQQGELDGNACAGKRDELNTVGGYDATGVERRPWSSDGTARRWTVVSSPESNGRRRKHACRVCRARARPVPSRSGMSPRASVPTTLIERWKRHCGRSVMGKPDSTGFEESLTRASRVPAGPTSCLAVGGYESAGGGVHAVAALGRDELDHRRQPRTRPTARPSTHSPASRVSPRSTVTR